MQLFEKPADYEAFEQVLRDTLALAPMRIGVYAVMPNYWHLLRPGFANWATREGRSSVQPSTWGGRSGCMDRAILTGHDLEFGIQCLPDDVVSSTFDNRRPGRSRRVQEEIVCMHFMFQGPQNPLYPLRSLLPPY